LHNRILELNCERSVISWKRCIAQTLQTPLISPGPIWGMRTVPLRFAARIALEHQPVANWQDKALAENSSPDAKLTALLALARCGGKELQAPLVHSMSQLSPDQLSEDQFLSALRVLGLCFIRMGEPSAEMSHDICGVLNQYYPSKSPATEP
jgi:hypothetical protein